MVIFSKPKGVREQKTFGRHSLGVFTGKGYFVIFLVAKECYLNSCMARCLLKNTNSVTTRIPVFCIVITIDSFPPLTVVLLMVMPSFHCDVRTESFNIIHMNLILAAGDILLYVFEDAT